MTEFLPELAFVYVVFLGALMSPGPDLLITLRNALGYSTRAGIMSALGIATGNIIHLTYSVAGIGLLITQNAVLFNLVKWAGAGYLVYIGIAALRSQGMDLSRDAVTQNLRGAHKSDRQAFANGFVTNVFNPKATMFFLALFSQMIDPRMPFSLLLGFCVLCMLTAFSWFSLVSVIMGVPPVRRAYSKASKWIDRVFGGVFIALAAKLALVRLG